MVRKIGRHGRGGLIWRQGWFGVLTATLVGVLTAWFVLPPVLLLIYKLRPVLLPVLIGLGLAYAVNPLVGWAHRRHRVPRWASVGGILLAGAAGVLLFLLIALPPMIAQGRELFFKLKDVYPKAVAAVMAHVSSADATEPRQVVAGLQSLADRLSKLNWAQVAAVAGRSLDVGVGVVGSAIGFTSYLALAGVVVLFCFFFFAWRFDRLTAWFVPFIPASRRRSMLRIVGMMDRSVSAFIRGRLIQALVMMVILSVGWLIVGVPYWLLLGVVSGLLNLIPFAAAAGWLLALGLTLIDAVAGGGGLTVWAFAGPTLVYFIAQLADGWVVEPIVQGRATDLDPLTVLLVVLIGGTLAGLLGVMIAIPAAACLKILGREVVLPRLRALAERC